MKVKFVSVEEGITALGFRRMVAISRKLNPGTEVYFVTTGNLYHWHTQIFPDTMFGFRARDLDSITQQLADADLLCFSSMTPAAPHVIRIAEEVKKKNPAIFILWGGVHCMLHPEESIRCVDAICTGEGEIPFETFYEAFAAGGAYLDTPGLWFNRKGGIIRNAANELNSSKTLSSFPHLFYDLACDIYDFKLGRFRKFTEYDYIKYNGLGYRTVWSMGCPFSCAYCANEAFLKINKSYGLIRYPPVDYIMEEIENAIGIYPFISAVVFYDDNLIAISTEVLQLFAREYQKRIRLPFVVFGMHPSFISEEKVELLARAGMNRTRMGFQSGNEKTLAFYNRPTPLADIRKSAKILAQAAKKHKMIPPAYDVISDNPLETRDDIVRTLEFLYEIERPYTLTVFSMRIFPTNKLWEYFKTHPLGDICRQTSSYLATKKTMANIVLYLLGIGKPPRIIFAQLIRRVQGDQDQQRLYPFLYLVTKSVYLVSRAVSHLCKLDFTTLVGPWVCCLWKVGLLKHGLKRRGYEKDISSDRMLPG